MKIITPFLSLLLISLLFSSCAVVGGIFKAGAWFGVLCVVGVLGIIIYFITRASKK